MLTYIWSHLPNSYRDLLIRSSSFLRVKYFLKSGKYLWCDRDISKIWLCKRRVVRSWRWSSLFNVDIEANFISKGLVLSNEDEIASEKFMFLKTNPLPLLRISFEIFQNTRKEDLFSSTLAWIDWVELHFKFSRTLLQWIQATLNAVIVLLNRYQWW